MQHPVVITVLFHPNDPASDRIARTLVKHFDKLGMQRAGVQMRIPVRVRSEPLQSDGSLRPIDSTAADLDVVVVLYGVDMEEERDPWRNLCRDAEQRRFPLLALLVAMDSGLKSFGTFSKVQDIRWYEWTGLDEAARAQRLIIHIVNAIRRRIFPKPAGQREPIFISHAKHDGKVAAERIVRHMSDPTNGLRLDNFYDALELESGEEWREGLRQAATRASMLCLITDSYDERPWCNQEILWAKENRRPLLLMDIGRSRVDRSFPYAGNMTLVRNPMTDASGIELALMELLSEGLRCDLFTKRVDAATQGKALALPRPPELADLAFLSQEDPGKAIVYPDPPLPDVEALLLQRLANGRRIVALSDF
jgi:hypothetical protein